MPCYSPEELRSFNSDVIRVSRPVRKSLFYLKIWRPRRTQNDVASPDTSGVQSQPTQVSDTNFSVRAAAAVETGPTHVSRDPAPPPHVVDWPSDNKIDPDNNKISTIRMATINLQSINRKASFVHDIISENNLSFLSATELWHTTSLDIPLLRTVPQGFRVIDQPRPVDPSSTRAPRTNHGGVAIFSSDRFSGKRLNLGFSPTTFELLACSLRSSSIIYTQVVIYRPGSEQVTDRFFDEITTLLEIVATFQSQVVISGDFNIHVDDPNDRHGHHLLEILDSFGTEHHRFNTQRRPYAGSRHHPPEFPTNGLRRGPTSLFGPRSGALCVLFCEFCRTPQNKKRSALEAPGQGLVSKIPAEFPAMRQHRHAIDYVAFRSVRYIRRNLAPTNISRSKRSLSTIAY